MVANKNIKDIVWAHPAINEAEDYEETAKLIQALLEAVLSIVGEDIEPHKEPKLDIKDATYLTNEEWGVNQYKAELRRNLRKAFE